MSEHLKLARLKIEAACKMKPTDEHAVKLEEMLYCLLLHLEAQQETPGSETSSAPTTGRAKRPSLFHGANPDTLFLSGQVMAQITAYFKSTPYMLPELAVTWPDSSTLQLTLTWPTPSTETTTDGGRGVAAPDSPASSPEPAQGGSEETHIHRHEVRRIEDMERRLEILEAQPTPWECLDCKEEFECDRRYYFSYCPKCHGSATRRARAPLALTNHEGRE